MFKKGFKYRIYPTLEQQVFLEKTFGCCRKVWNTLLAEAVVEHKLFKQDKNVKPSLNSYDFCRKLTKLKNDQYYEYLNEVSSKALQISALSLGNSFQKFFKEKKGYPKFKSKHSNKHSFTLESYETGAKYFWIKNKVFTISKCDTPIKVRWHRKLPSCPTQVTISKNASGEYYASFLCEVYPEMTNGTGKVGIDLGIKTLASLSNGEDILNPKHYVKAQKKLAKYQRRLSKKQKGSKNRNKARIKVAKVHQHIANQRQDYLHKLSRSLVNDNQVIVIEDLHVKGMSRNRKLAKHILDAGMGMFRQMLTYKVIESNWCTLLIADRFYPSTQLCSNCGVRPLVKIKLGVTHWTCHSCKTEHGRDTNAAKNLVKLVVDRPELWLNHPGKVLLSKPYKELMSA
jgi:putative transposase